MFNLKKILLSMFLVVSVPFTLLNASEDHNLTDTQLHAVMGIITSFILMPSSKELALQKIQMYAQTNGSTLVPNIQDYEDAEVTGVATGNLMELNEAVEYLGALDVDTTEEIQALVDALGSGGQGSSIVHNNTTYGTVTSPYTGKVWLDRNLGAAQVCTSYNDTACYGDYYQWGRNFDGHQDSGSGNTPTLATDVNNVGHGDFIWEVGMSAPYDWASVDSDGSLRSENWSKIDGTSVCPSGFRVPTINEFKAELIDSNSAQVQNNQDVYNTFLKLPSAGESTCIGPCAQTVGYAIHLWTSTASQNSLYIFGTYINASGLFRRAMGASVRCLKD